MPRTLSEAEFEQVKAKALASLPPNLTEAEFNRLAPSALAAAIGEAENLPPTPQGSAASRLVSNAGGYFNPVTIATGLYNAVKSPEAVGQTLEHIYNASAAQGAQAVEAARQGRYSEMLGHGAAMLPLVGPAAAAAGEQIAQGDIAGGIGSGVGLIGSIVAPGAVAKGVAARLPAVAEALQSGAKARVVDVIAPKVGRQKVRFGTMAEDVAPTLLEDPALTKAWSREGLQANVGAAFEEAKTALDAAHDARLNARAFKTQPLIDALLERRRRLTSEAVEATGISPLRITVEGKPASTWIRNRGPVGADVVPGPNAPRVAQIDQAIEELRRLGPEARYESLRVMRAAYDIPAEVTYAPSVTADFLTKQGGARGASDVTGALREFLAGHEPATATANARFSLMKTADDVLEATREVERVRPAVGRKMLTAFLGGTTGGALGGAPGMAIGAVLGPILDSAYAAGVTTKLQTATLMRQLAVAIERGNPQAVASVGARLRARLPQLGPLLAQLQAQAAAGIPAPTTAQAGPP
jgi:hypothetical protein